MLPLRALINRALFPPLRSCCYDQIRTTFVLRRKYPARLLGKSGVPKRMKPREFIYELLEDTETVKQQDIKVILTSSVEGVGSKGEVVSVRPNFARNSLLLPGLAVYASPENLEAWKDYQHIKKEEKQFSSPFAPRTIRRLSGLVLAVTMNSEEPWTLEKWNLRVCFRKSGFIVPEHAIEMPFEPITGPDMDKQGKDFVIFVTVNGEERVPVRCRLLHCHSNPLKHIPRARGWFYKPAPHLFPEQAELLSTMPLPVCKEVDEETVMN